MKRVKSIVAGLTAALVVQADARADNEAWRRAGELIERAEAVRVTIDADHQPLFRVLDQLSAQLGAPIRVDFSVAADLREQLLSEHISVQLIDVPALDALDHVLALLSIPRDREVTAEAVLDEFVVVDRRASAVPLGAELSFFYAWEDMNANFQGAARTVGARFDAVDREAPIEVEPGTGHGLKVFFWQWLDPLLVSTAGECLSHMDKIEFFHGGFRMTTTARRHFELRRLMKEWGRSGAKETMTVECRLITIPRDQWHARPLGGAMPSAEAIGAEGDSTLRWQTEGEVAPGAVYRAQSRLDDGLELFIMLSPEPDEWFGSRWVPISVIGRRTDGQASRVEWQTQMRLADPRMAALFELPLCAEDQTEVNVLIISLREASELARP